MRDAFPVFIQSLLTDLLAVDPLANGSQSVGGWGNRVNGHGVRVAKKTIRWAERVKNITIPSFLFEPGGSGLLEFV